jgi:4-coumarate--CoA ligase
MQVVPSELRGKLLEYPDVEDLSVVAHWIEGNATHLPVAFVVLSSKSKQRKREVMDDVHDWLNPGFANHKKLRGGICVIEAISKSPNVKISRRKAAELLKTLAPNKGAEL